MRRTLSAAPRKGRFFQIAAKIARFFVVLRPFYVRRQLALRTGTCNRCGQCCSLGYTCPFLQKLDGSSRCRIYGYRFTQCAIFPISRFDLSCIAECSYRFKDRAGRVSASGRKG